MQNSNYYPIGAIQCTQEQFYRILSQFDVLKNIQNASEIKGPFDGKINTIYQINWENHNSMIFRARISKAFRYEPIVKEKILYHFLDQTLSEHTPNLFEKINQLTLLKSGSHIFSENNPSIIPVQDMYYYYEPPENISISNLEPHVSSLLPPKPFPYLLTIKKFIPGNSLYEIIQRENPENYLKPAFQGIFEQAGEFLAKLHSVKFDAFYEKITDIGSHHKPSWKELFIKQWNSNLKDASQYKPLSPLLSAIEKYYRDNVWLAEAETEAVLFHNDYQSQNLIIKNNIEKSNDSKNKFSISAVIDFDNWRIGPRAQDFVKMEYWTIQDREYWRSAFYQGYSKIFPITKEMKECVQLYKLSWFLLVYAFEMDKIRKNELNSTVDNRFPAAEKYLIAIQSIVQNYL